MKKINKNYLVLPLSALLSFTACLAQAQTASGSITQASLAATCAACHQNAAAQEITTPVPSLRGQSAQEIESKMLAFKADQLAGTIMPQIAKGYTERQIRDIAEYLGKK